MSRPRILVINPNSNHLVTQGLEEALKPLGFDGKERLDDLYRRERGYHVQSTRGYFQFGNVQRTTYSENALLYSACERPKCENRLYGSV